MAPSAASDGGGFGQRPKRRRIGSENAITKVNPAEPKTATYFCVSCQKDISHVVRIKCVVCNDMVLCVECFSVGVEIQGHKACHPYRVVDNLSFPLFTPDWSADEELLLLEGVELYGLGNWTEVAEHVGTKNKVQCHSHYFDTYINAPTTPLPDLDNVIGKDPQRLEQAIQRQKEKAVEAAAAAAAAAPAVNPDGTPAPAVDPEVQHRATLAAFARPPDPRLEGNAYEMTGFNAKRNEFEPEHDATAEAPLADMEFRVDDSEADRALKLRMLRIYNDRLDERARRKQFVLDRGLLNVRKLQAIEKKRSKEERDLYARMRVFARYHSQAEHEALLEGMVAEQRLRKRIDELKEYRRNGIHTLSEAEVFETEKRRREAERARQKLLESPGPLSAGGKGGAGRANRYLSREGSTIPLLTPPASTSATRELAQLMSQGGNVLPGVPNAATVLASGLRTRKMAPLDVTGLPGSELLNARERDLCSQLRLLPVHYLSMKDVLLRASLRDGHVSRTSARTLFKVDPYKVDQVFNLLALHNWVKAEPGGEGGNGAGGAGADGEKGGAAVGTADDVMAEAGE